jgi:hypothetical protein
MSAADESWDSKVEWYRSRAADCINLGATAPTPEAKALLENMAEKWLHLADVIEKRAKCHDEPAELQERT